MKHPHYGVVNWFVRLAIEGKAIPIFGDGAILRDFLYVDDCVEAMILAAESPRARGEILNVGRDEPSSFLEIAETIADVIPGTKVEFTEFSPERRAQEPGDFYSDISKIRAICGWTPRTSLRDGLAKTVAYYQRHRVHYW